MIRKSKAATENLEVQAKKMMKFSSEKFPSTRVGDTLTAAVQTLAVYWLSSLHLKTTNFTVL
jgi:hypothetical protein